MQEIYHTVYCLHRVCLHQSFFLNLSHIKMYNVFLNGCVVNKISFAETLKSCENHLVNLLYEKTRASEWYKDLINPC